MAARTARLTKQDWVVAGLQMIGENGVAGLAVEPLARRMGSTKGSFYWHFADIDALLAAILEYWRVEQTDRVIARIEEMPSERRLEELLAHSTSPGHESATLALMAAAGDPRLGPVVAEVQQRRIAYLQHLFQARGLPTAKAKLRARISYAAYLGHLLLSGPPGDGVHARSTTKYRAELMRMLETDWDAEDGSSKGALA